MFEGMEPAVLEADFAFGRWELFGQGRENLDQWRSARCPGLITPPSGPWKTRPSECRSIRFKTGSKSAWIGKERLRRLLSCRTDGRLSGQPWPSRRSV